MRALLLAVTLSLSGPALAAPTVRVAVVDGLTRVKRDQALPATPATVKVSGARNEWVGFQVVVTGGSEALQAADATAAPLRGPRGTTLPAPALYREHYVEVKQPSYRCKEPPGWWPDALLPLHPADGDRLSGKPRFVGAPFDVEAGRNQPLYAEMHVPPDAPAGVYRGAITVSAPGRKAVRVPVTLTVWDFALPRTPSCQSNFGGFWRVAEHAGLRAGSPEAERLLARYERALMDHRLMPASPAGVNPRRAVDGTPDMQTIAPALEAFFGPRGGSALQIPVPFEDPAGKSRDQAVRYLRGYQAYLAAHGWADRAYLYMIDEPNDAAAYEQVRRLAAMAHEADPKIRFLCTEQPVASEAAWGTLVGAVNVWCPLWALWDDASVRARLAAGDQVWSYTALCQGRRETPYWQLDFPLLNYRVASWQNWVSGSTGLLYWTAVFWEKTPDVWTDPRTYGEGQYVYNGEGMLLYPGAEAGIEGPVASLRLKAIRDGMQDYDYLALLAARKGRPAAEAVARQIARDWFDWDRDPATLLTARERLARAILAK